jgi:hypothetical protein
MRRDDVRFAAAARDDGIRKISKFTWRAGAAGVVFSAVVAVAFGHHVATQATTGHTGTQQPTTGSTGSGGTGSGGTGSGGTGNSSSGGTGSGSGGSGQGGQGTIVVPAQPPAPAQGSGQVTSGAS